MIKACLVESAKSDQEKTAEMMGLNQNMFSKNSNFMNESEGSESQAESV